MPRYQHLLFVCSNERPANSPKGCCATKGAAELLGRLKERCFEAGLKGVVRVTSSGCLDACSQGCTVVALSEDGAGQIQETWYGGVTPADADALFESHISEGQVLERLAITPPPRAKSPFG